MKNFNVATFRHEICDRANQILSEIVADIKKRGITDIRDSRTCGIYCNMFLLDDAVRVRAMTRKDDDLFFELENGFCQGMGTVEPVDIRGFGEGAVIEVIDWLDSVLMAIDKGVLSVRDGVVTPTTLLGLKVRWHDPAIADFQPEDRELQSSRVYTVIDEDPENNYALIKDEYGETEVCITELELVPAK